MVAGLKPNCQPKIKGENDARSGSGRSKGGSLPRPLPRRPISNGHGTSAIRPHFGQVARRWL